MIRKIFSLLLGASVLLPAFAFAATDSMMMQSDKGMMSGDHMDKMMTKGLDGSCKHLRSLSTDEKSKMLTDIGHNMDADALRSIFRCMFAGKVKRIAVITDNDLKLNPKDREFLYFIPATQQFFATCKSMNTVAYVIQSDGTSDPKNYFKQNRSMFTDAAKMAKEMMDSSMEKDGVIMKSDDAMMKKDEGAMMKKGGAMMKKEDAMMKAGEYKDSTASALSASVLADGKTKVLFFHAGWCPACKAANTTLTAWYNPGNGLLTTYKINYDTEKLLKQKYGVTYQYTFVKIDGQGKLIKLLQSPSDEDLKNFLKP